MAEKVYSSDPRSEEDKKKGSPWEELTFDEGEAVRWFDELNETLQREGISKISKTDRILEVGTGGAMLMHLLNRRGYNVVGVDGRPRHEGSLPIAATRIENLPFANDVFDVILARGVFASRYSQDRQKMLKELERVLKPAGIFYGIFKANTPEERITQTQGSNFELMKSATATYNIFRKPGRTEKI